MENGLLKVRQTLEKELENVEDRIYTISYNRLDEWNKGYLQGKELGLQLAIQELTYAIARGE